MEEQIQSELKSIEKKINDILEAKILLDEIAKITQKAEVLLNVDIENERQNFLENDFLKYVSAAKQVEVQLKEIFNECLQIYEEPNRQIVLETLRQNYPTRLSALAQTIQDIGDELNSFNKRVEDGRECIADFEKCAILMDEINTVVYKNNILTEINEIIKEMDGGNYLPLDLNDKKMSEKLRNEIFEYQTGVIQNLKKADSFCVDTIRPEFTKIENDITLAKSGFKILKLHSVTIDMIKKNNNVNLTKIKNNVEKIKQLAPSRDQIADSLFQIFKYNINMSQIVLLPIFDKFDKKLRDKESQNLLLELFLVNYHTSEQELVAFHKEILYVKDNISEDFGILKKFADSIPINPISDLDFYFKPETEFNTLKNYANWTTIFIIKVQQVLYWKPFIRYLNYKKRLLSMKYTTNNTKNLYQHIVYDINAGDVSEIMDIDFSLPLAFKPKHLIYLKNVCPAGCVFFPMHADFKTIRWPSAQLSHEFPLLKGIMESRRGWIYNDYDNMFLHYKKFTDQTHHSNITLSKDLLFIAYISVHLPTDEDHLRSYNNLTLPDGKINRFLELVKVKDFKKYSTFWEKQSARLNYENYRFGKPYCLAFYILQTLETKLFKKDIIIKQMSMNPDTFDDVEFYQMLSWSICELCLFTSRPFVTEHNAERTNLARLEYQMYSKQN